MKVAVYDLESQNGPITGPDGSKDWNLAHMGISSGVVWVSWQGGVFGRYRTFQRNGIEKLVALLEEADLVVDFNGTRFDKPLLETVLEREVLYTRHCDLFAHVYSVIRRRIGLDNLARATLGEGKYGSGRHAPELARQALWGELFDYNMRDVELTLRLYMFARTHGYLLCERHDRSVQRIPIEVPAGRTVWEERSPYKERRQKREWATERQIKLLRDLYAQDGMEGWQPPYGLTKQTASNMIDQKLREQKGKVA